MRGIFFILLGLFFFGIAGLVYQVGKSLETTSASVTTPPPEVARTGQDRH